MGTADRSVRDSLRLWVIEMGSIGDRDRGEESCWVSAPYAQHADLDGGAKAAGTLTIQCQSGRVVGYTTGGGETVSSSSSFKHSRDRSHRLPPTAATGKEEEKAWSSSPVVLWKPPAVWTVEAVANTAVGTDYKMAVVNKRSLGDYPVVGSIYIRRREEEQGQRAELNGEAARVRSGGKSKRQP